MSVISPELVLVDPELARRARAELPDPGELNGGVVAARSNGRPPTAVRRPIVGAGAVARPRPAPAFLPLIGLQQAAEAEIEREAAQDHARPQGLVLVAAGIALFILGVVVPPFFAGGDPVLRQPPPSVQRPETSAIGRAASSDGVSGRAVEPPVRKAVSARAPTRLFAWLSDRRARYYHVRFSKGTRTVFEAWPTDARVTVPLRGRFRGRSFAFTPGRYRWAVRPAFGLRSQARYGAPIVRSVWVVGPEEAGLP
jgi:hypothetical protein